MAIEDAETTDNQEEIAPGLVSRRASDVVLEDLSQPLVPGLYIVATPIGNLADISLRALNVLARADIIACEDTRRSRTLLSHFSIGGKLLAYHEHNAVSVRPGLLEAIGAGKAVALISDAGTPLISDPGYKLVEEVRERGYGLTSIPGACSPIVALTLSGLPTDRFFFEGFLPAKSGQRQKRLALLSEIPGSLIIFETAKRLTSCLDDLAGAFQGRSVVVAKELTKRYETVHSGSFRDVAGAFAAEELRGEFVIVVAPPGVREISDVLIAEQLAALLPGGSFKDGVKLVAERLGVSRSRVYDVGLRLKNQTPELDGE